MFYTARLQNKINKMYRKITHAHTTCVTVFIKMISARVVVPRVPRVLLCGIRGGLRLFGLFEIDRFHTGNTSVHRFK